MPTNRRWEVRELSTDFRQAAVLVEDAFAPLPGPGRVLVRNHFVGINATDVNITNGSYTTSPPPFGCGLEGGTLSSASDYRCCADQWKLITRLGLQWELWRMWELA
ncbi:hypothetical protein PINS_up012414 [Pythium insidiosum]|nr:hypothetical protein PINS_up012414 [Pythium insidiosum]